MQKTVFISSLALVLAGTAGCTGSEAKEAPKGATGSAAGSAVSKPSAPTSRSLASGTRIDASIQDALSSRTNKPGEMLRAVVSRDVSDARGNVVIPAGADVTLRIDQLEPGSDQVRPEGRLSLTVASVLLHGQPYTLEATLDPVPHTMVGRGVTTDEAGRIAAGTAIGAVAGQLIGKNTKSTVIGGAVGAVAGGAVAVRYAYRDVVISAGTPIAFTLTQELKVAR